MSPSTGKRGIFHWTTRRASKSTPVPPTISPERSVGEPILLRGELEKHLEQLDPPREPDRRADRAAGRGRARPGQNRAPQVQLVQVLHRQIPPAQGRGWERVGLTHSGLLHQPPEHRNRGQIRRGDPGRAFRARRLPQLQPHAAAADQEGCDQDLLRRDQRAAQGREASGRCLVPRQEHGAGTGFDWSFCDKGAGWAQREAQGQRRRAGRGREHQEQQLGAPQEAGL